MGMTLQDGLDLIGRGQSLRVPQDGSMAEFMALYPDYPSKPCPRQLAEEITRHPSIFHMTEMRVGNRSGWRELRWPEGSDYYCFVQ